MQIFENGLKGISKVVGASEVEALSLKGWKLVYTYQDTSPMPCYEQEEATGQNAYAGQTVNVTRHHPLTLTMFILKNGIVFAN